MNNKPNTHTCTEKTIDREVVVTGATTSRVGHAGTIRSTPKCFKDNDFVPHSKMRHASDNWTQHLCNIVSTDILPQIELWTNLLGDSFFFL